MSDYVPHGAQTDPKGVVKALFQENTFTELDDFIEIYQNSDDALSKNVKVEFIKYNDKTFLFISDDGIGMDIETMDRSLNLLGETSGERKHGKFNFGGKAGILHLSGINDYLQSKGTYRGKCIVISKKLDCEPVCYEMVGKELIERGWDGQVKGPVIIGSGDESTNSKELFEQYPIINTGTNIFIELTETREKNLIEIEPELRNELSLACNERLNHCKMSISLSDTIDANLKYKPILKSEIIDEKKHTTHISVYMKNTERIYVVEEGETKLAIKSISKKNNRFSKKLEPLKDIDLERYEKKGVFTLSSACDYEYMIKKNKKYIDANNLIYVIRNGFCLNYYDNSILQKKASSNAGGGQKNGKAGDYFKKGIYSNTKSTLTYESDDIMDSLIGVNMQKADIKFEKLDKPFQRTIEQLVLKHADIFIKYIRENEYEPQQEAEEQDNIEQVTTDQETTVQETTNQISEEQETTNQISEEQASEGQDIVEQETREANIEDQNIEEETTEYYSDTDTYNSALEPNTEDKNIEFERKIIEYLNSDEKNTEMDNELLEVMNKYGY